MRIINLLRSTYFGWPLAALLCSTPALALEGPPSGIEIEVSVAEEISGANALKRWVREESKSAVMGSTLGKKSSGTLKIGVAGDLYDYEVTVSAYREDIAVGEPETWTCECSNEELLKNVRAKVPSVARRLRVAAPSVEVRPKPNDESGSPPETVQGAGEDEGPELELRPSKPATIAGATLMSIGALGIGAGVPLIVVGEHPRPPVDLPWSQIRFTPLRTAGIITSSVGAAALVTGTILLSLRNRIGCCRDRSAMLTPSLDPSGRIALSLSGRF